MPLSRRALLRASAVAALTAASSPAGSPDGRPPAATGTTSSSSPSATESLAAGTPGAPASVEPAGPATEVRHGPRTVPAVALTFHGNGEVTLARQLLRELERRGVPGSVLAVGSWLQAEPAMAARIMAGGHDLGNHTLHHYPMRDLGSRAAFDEIAGCARVLHRTSGSRGRWFRASGTQATTPTIRRAAGRAGYQQCVSYDVDGLDWRDPPTSTVVRAVLDGARPGSIVSLHLGHPVTLAALPEILDGLQTSKLQPVTLTDLLG